MRALSEVIKRARAHLAGGWHEPLSLASDGTICDSQCEGIARFCCHDALLTAAGDVDGFREAEQLVTKQLPGDLPHVTAWGHAMSLNEWAAMPGRTHDEVLVLFDQAARHALTREAA